MNFSINGILSFAKILKSIKFDNYNNATFKKTFPLKFEESFNILH